MFGWINLRAVLPYAQLIFGYALLIFGLFVEIFIVCELFIFLMNLAAKRARALNLTVPTIIVRAGTDGDGRGPPPST